MPLYCYQCPECEAEFERQLSIAERHSAVCECGEPAKLILKPSKGRGISLFRPYMEMNADFEPHWIETPQQLRDLCDKRNCYSERLQDGIWKTSPGPDPDSDAPGIFGQGVPRRHSNPRP